MSRLRRRCSVTPSATNSFQCDRNQERSGGGQGRNEIQSRDSHVWQGIVPPQVVNANMLLASGQAKLAGSLPNPRILWLRRFGIKPPILHGLTVEDRDSVGLAIAVTNVKAADFESEACALSRAAEKMNPSAHLIDFDPIHSDRKGKARFLAP